MNPGPSLRRLLTIAFLAAALLYVGGFTLNEHLRTRRGPWEVRFQNTTNGTPALVVSQPALRIQDVQIQFNGFQTSQVPTTIRFESPHQSIPFGEVKYDDLTYLPGVVTIDLFGHEVELLPRTLYVDRQPIPWGRPTNIVIQPNNRSAPQGMGSPR